MIICRGNTTLEMEGQVGHGFKMDLQEQDMMMWLKYQRLRF
jgi:hypothetical protein